MQTVALTWQQAGELAGVCAVVGIGLAVPPQSTVRAIGAFVRELAIVAGLYALWQLAGQLSNGSTVGAFHRAHWVERFDDALPLPSEHTVQSWVLPHPLLVQGLNYYYDTMHLTVKGIFLVWLFIRHRDHYRPVRTTLAVATLGCLLVQLISVAPPRMLPGFTDTAIQYGQSVYSNGLPIDQLSAMPSLHVCWATLVGYYVWRTSPSRWRWIGPAHTVVTVFAVLATANHWWLDGIVADTILVISAWLVIGVRAAITRLWDGLRTRVHRNPTTVVPLPEPALAED